MNNSTYNEHAVSTTAESQNIPELFSWEQLPVEERKRRVEIRMKNLGKYKGLVFINDPKLRGEA